MDLSIERDIVHVYIYVNVTVKKNCQNVALPV